MQTEHSKNARYLSE